jgi:hypothetical protein
MSWTEIIPSISESVGKLFGIIDKAVPDVTERDKLKVGLTREAEAALLAKLR